MFTAAPPPQVNSGLTLCLLPWKCTFKAMKSPPKVELLTKPGCHLCQDAREVVRDVCAELELNWEEVSIAGDPVLADRFAEEIPVVMVDGVQRDFWTIDPGRLRTILETILRAQDSSAIA